MAKGLDIEDFLDQIDLAKVVLLFSITIKYWRG